MLVEQVSDLLASEGYVVIGSHTVHVLIASGKVARPPWNNRGQLVFDESHLDALRRVLRKRGDRAER
jgi:hypothetical protein